MDKTGSLIVTIELSEEAKAKLSAVHEAIKKLDEMIAECILLIEKYPEDNFLKLSMKQILTEKFLNMMENPKYVSDEEIAELKEMYEKIKNEVTFISEWQ